MNAGIQPSGITAAPVRKPLDLTWDEYRWPLFFLLSMSMMGLKFPVGYLLVPIILIERFRADRYDFLIMISLFFGSFGLVGENALPVKFSDLGFVTALVGLVIYRKRGVVRKTALLIAAYGIALVILATFSDESMKVQLLTLRMYLYFIYFIVPFMVFSGREFNLFVFFRRLSPYFFILCVFYILDAIVFNGHIMLPGTFIWDERVSTFYSPVLYGLGYFPRIYPPGLFIAAWLVFPFARYYRLSRIQWLLAIVGMAVTRTFTFISGVIAGYVVSGSDIGRTVKYGLLALVAMVGLYLLDTRLPGGKEDESFLRIASSVKQITDLGAAQDDEDVAELGSGRLGQALPKLELVSQYDKEATGLGFLHGKYTTDTRYIIDNPFYNDGERAIEVATGIEIEPLQVYVTIGYIGLIVHILFFVFTYLFIRRLEYSYYYVTVLVTVFVFGLGGFAPLNSTHGLILSSVAFSAVILHNRSLSKSKIA